MSTLDIDVISDPNQVMPAWLSEILRAAGVLVRGPLERVPENAIKFAVGLLLTSFGCFWGAEGAGVDWPGDELSLLAVLGFLGALSFVLVRLLRRQRLALSPSGAEA